MPFPEQGSATDAWKFQVGDVLAGATRNYRLVRMLGSGAMGTVFLADVIDASPAAVATEQPYPQQVAIKILMRGIAGGTDLLRRELSAMHSVKHPRIARLLDWRLTPAPGFMVFQYYAEGSLQDHLRRSGTLTIEQGWTLLEDLISALVAIHRASVLHLDVKPGNTLLDETGHYHLADFGIAQGSRVPAAVVPSGLGTPLFQAPEQKARDHDRLDARTDLWGVGITVWAALTGVPNERIEQIRDDFHRRNELALNPSAVDFPPISQHRADCPPSLDQIVDTMMKHHRRHRPGSAAEVLTQVVEAKKAWEDGRAGFTPPAPGTEKPPRTAAEFIAGATEIPANEHAALAAGLFDPLWSSLLGGRRSGVRVVRIPSETVISRQGQESYYTIVILSGTVCVVLNGVVVAREEREGTFLGEVTALTGTRRTADLVAENEVVAIVLNPAELESILGNYPALAIRLLKDLAGRLQQERARNALPH